MKRNLMTVVILALVVLNLAMTGVIMFFTVSANSKTIALIDNIASVLDLEIAGLPGASENVVPVDAQEVYDIADAMTIALKTSPDGSDHYAMVMVSFTLDKTHEDYATYQPMVAEKESKLKSEIIDVIGSYTKEEAMADKTGLENAILSRVQSMFGSNFIYEAYFRDIKFQ